MWVFKGNKGGKLDVKWIKSVVMGTILRKYMIIAGEVQW